MVASDVWEEKKVLLFFLQMWDDINEVHILYLSWIFLAFANFKGLLLQIWQWAKDLVFFKKVVCTVLALTGSLEDYNTNICVEMF